MMIDSSAMVAIVLHEPEADRLVDALDLAFARMISAVSWVETMMVAEARQGAAGDVRLALAEFKVELVPFDERQALHAYEAWRRFGKGRHPAGLNFGDCCAYAAALAYDQPLLFKGGDFSLTDIEAAPW